MHPASGSGHLSAAGFDRGTVYGTPTRQFFEKLLLERELSPPAQICEMVTFPLAERMVMASDAIGLLTYSPAKLELARQHLAILVTDILPSRRPIGLTLLKTASATPAQAIFMNAMISALPPAP